MRVVKDCKIQTLTALDTWHPYILYLFPHMEPMSTGRSVWRWGNVRTALIDAHTYLWNHGIRAGYFSPHVPYGDNMSRVSVSFLFGTKNMELARCLVFGRDANLDDDSVGYI